MLSVAPELSHYIRAKKLSSVIERCTCPTSTSNGGEPLGGVTITYNADRGGRSHKFLYGGAPGLHTAPNSKDAQGAERSLISGLIK